MRRVLTFGCLCLLACPSASEAEWHLTPMVGVTFAGNTSIVDPELATRQVHGQFGGAVSLLGGGVLGIEGIVVLTPGFFKGDVDLLESSRSIAVMGNVVVTAPRRWTEYNLRPFVSAGVGVLHVSFVEKNPGVGPLNENIAGFNVGGGAVGFFSPRTGVRFDLRYYSNLYGQSGEFVTLTSEKIHLRYMTASVGLVLRR
jgi:hypothetical protein